MKTKHCFMYSYLIIYVVLPTRLWQSLFFIYLAMDIFFSQKGVKNGENGDRKSDCAFMEIH